jgi:DNA recombination protein RmuC
VEWILGFCLGAFSTGITLFFFSRRHIQALSYRLETTVAFHEKEEQILMEDTNDLRQSLHHEQSRCAVLEERASRLPVLENQLSQSMRDCTDLRARGAELAATLDYQRQQAREKIALLEEAQVRLGQSFKALSADALAANNRSFLELAQSTLSRFQESAQTDLTIRQKAIGEMLTPVHHALVKVDGKLLDLEKERVGAYQVLRNQVAELVHSQKELRQETSNLVKALRSPNVRGQWGEMQLKRVVEMAGMVAYCDFTEQVSGEGENGRLRPDMIVNLPGGNKVVVDAKAPLSAYLESLEAADEQTRSDRLTDHARQVRNHIRQLSQRAYWDQFQPTPEFVVLFLPGETFFSAALEKDPTLIEAGVREKVILATPTTLIALLRAVAYGWRQESITENAREISNLGRELYKRLSDMGTHMTKLGRQLGQVVDSYNQTVGTLERRVLVTARKFRALDSSNEDIEEMSPLDHAPRQVQSLELVGEEGILSTLLVIPEIEDEKAA